MVKCSVTAPGTDLDFVTGDGGLQFDVDGLALHIFVDGPNGETIDLEIPVDEAKRDLLIMLGLIDGSL